MIGIYTRCIHRSGIDSWVSKETIDRLIDHSIDRSGIQVPYYDVLRTAQSYYDLDKKISQTAVVLIACASRVLYALCIVVLPFGAEHLRTPWSGPEQSHFLPEACSPIATDN